MENFLHGIVNIINIINENIGRAVAWLTTVLVLLVCGDVAGRYFFNDTAAWVMELEWHLFALIFILGAGYALKHDRHVRVDLFYAKFSKKDKAWVNLIGGLLFLIPWCCLMIAVAYDYAMTSWIIKEGSPDPGGLPARYFIKFSIVIGICLLLLQAIASVAQSILVIRSQHTEEGLQA